MSKLGKLRRLSVDELRVRGSQAVAAFAERRGWSALAKLPSDQALLKLLDPAQTPRELWSAQEFLDHFRGRREPKFFSSFDDPSGTVAELRRRWPAAEREIVEHADRLVAGRFYLLGLRDLSFGDPIDWHLEPVAGKRAPFMHWSRLDYLDAELAGDKKITWELNRHQYFATLGQAYWLAGDERYAKAFVTHLDSWMDQNPPKLGINWTSSLEIAFRAISWLWAFYFFKDSPSFSSRTFMRAVKFLYLSARHLETYLSTYFSPNTHLTGEALGLFYLGTLLPEFRAASRWRETGRRILLEQLPIHVQPDGVYFEQSSYYHRYTTDFYTHFLILSRLNGNDVSTVVEGKLKALLDHLMYITRPDGTTPFFGDDDGGRLVMLDRRASNDFRAPLATGASLFSRADYKFVAGEAAAETLWLMGSDGLAAFDQLLPQEPAQQSAAFAEGGYYVMRDGWAQTSDYLLIDCGPHGTNNCGHAHGDALAFELCARGRTLLVDPGTCTYTGSNELRDWFRSSSGHNALTVDGESSSVSAGPFSWKSIARCQTLDWISRARFDYFTGRHDGYRRLSAPVDHTRSVLFLKHDYWVMRDCCASSGQHSYDLWFHFDSGTDVALATDRQGMTAVAGSGEESGLQIITFAENGSWRKEDGWVSHCYGDKAPASVCVFSVPAKDAIELITFLRPSMGLPMARPSVREVEAIGGRAFEVVSEKAHDIVMISGGGRVEMARLSSDFEWTWARFSHSDAPVPEELVLIGGHSLELEGREILKSERRINFLVVSRFGDQFRLETDEGVLDLGLPIGDLESVLSNLRSQI